MTEDGYFSEEILFQFHIIQLQLVIRNSTNNMTAFIHMRQNFEQKIKIRTKN